MKLEKSIFAILLMATSLTVWAQDGVSDKDMFRPLTTGVTSLGIAPDARGASMGDLGAATEADVNSQFWNPSKYAFAYSKAGVSLSYTPWLRKIVNDIYLANLAGYYKVGGSDNQAVSASLRYFSLGEVSATEGYTTVATINPYELSLDLGYSRKLSEKFSMGVVLRYIYSDMGQGDISSGELTSSASAFSADMSGYYTTYPIIGRNECQWSLGFNLSNIGSKVSFDRGNNPAYLPANLRLGTAFTFPLAEFNFLTIGLDANRLLVPAKPRLEDFNGDENAFGEAEQAWKDKSSISGIFDSFSDDFAKRITYSVGAEYNYNQRFFLRGGYYYESKFAGNRRYFGMGAGFALQVIKIDASYMIATSQDSPLDQTLRFTLSFDMDGIRDLFGGS